MATNTIILVNQVRDRMHKGWNDGIDEKSARDIPVLLRRIDELEQALVPLAEVAQREIIDNPNGNKPLLACRRQDAFNAKDLLDINKSVRPTVEDFGIPA